VVTNPRVNGKQGIAIGLSVVIFLPLSMNALLFSENISHLLVGSGQLRIILWQWLVFVALVLIPVRAAHISWLLYLILFAAVINASYSVLGVWGVVDADHWVAIRDGRYRAAGLFEMPSRLGVLITVGVGVLFLLRMPMLLKGIFVGLLLYALFLSGSRTGVVGVSLVSGLQLVAVATSRRAFRFAFLAFSAVSISLLVLLGWTDVAGTDAGRMLAFGEAIWVWESNKMGIALGDWIAHARLPPPHNSLLFFLVYGGAVSALGFIAFAGSLMTSFAVGAHSGQALLAERFYPTLLGFLGASLFEQVALQASNMIYFLLILSIFVTSGSIVMSGAETAGLSSAQTRRGYAIPWKPPRHSTADDWRYW
jgi:hypothetical protein